MTERSEFTAKFIGQMADNHKLPAYQASKSLYGISRSILLASMYLESGKVKRRNLYGDSFKLNVTGFRSGSFETVFEFIAQPPFIQAAGALGIGVGSNAIWSFIQTVFRRSIGERGAESIEELENSGELNPGDSTALVEAAEPAIREAHTAIGKGASNIVIIRGDNNIVNFNSASKDYVYTNVMKPEYYVSLVSIASFNANSGYGRAFNYEEKRTIPFTVVASLDKTSVSNMMNSMTQYALSKFDPDLKSAVAIKYKKTESVDGRVKKITISKARRSIDDL